MPKVTANLTDEAIAELDAAATVLGVSRADFIRTAIEEKVAAEANEEVSPAVRSQKQDVKKIVEELARYVMIKLPPTELYDDEEATAARLRWETFRCKWFDHQ